MKDKKLAKLEELYANKHRHSQYQILASSLEGLVEYEKPLKSKYEGERFDYIKKNVVINGKKILDIGGNTGFFTFESCALNPLSVDYYEGQVEHAEFVKLAAEVINLSDVIRVHPEYFLFEMSDNIWDVAFFLNVIHHIGFDFEQDVTIDTVKKKMLEHINSMAAYSKTMVFQMGFNWYGDIKQCLFEHGTKEEMENYIIKGTEQFWTVEKIGIPEKQGDNIVYADMTVKNNMRIDELGEFLNRPLFIMRSNILK